MRKANAAGQRLGRLLIFMLLAGHWLAAARSGMGLIEQTSPLPNTASVDSGGAI